MPSKVLNVFRFARYMKGHLWEELLYYISFCTDLEEQNSHLSSCLRFLFIVVGKVLNITVGKKPSNLRLRYVMLQFTNKIQFNLHLRSHPLFSDQLSKSQNNCTKGWGLKSLLLKWPLPSFSHPKESLPIVLTSIKRPSTVTGWYTDLL